MPERRESSRREDVLELTPEEYEAMLKNGGEPPVASSQPPDKVPASG